MAEEEAPAAPLKGKFVFPDGSSYEGEYKIVEEEKKVRDGEGVFINGKERYEGAWKDDVMTGKGKFEAASGASYEGDFLDNQFHGNGVYRWTDGAVYEGGFRFNQMHGEGRYIAPDGVKWEGTFEAGMFSRDSNLVPVR